MVDRQRPGILLRLPMRRLHELVPGLSCGSLASWFQLGDEKVRQTFYLHFLRAACLSALLRLHDEAAALVEVDAPDRLRAVRRLEIDPALEAEVVAVDALTDARLGSLDAEELTKLDGEHGKICPLGAAGLRPALDKVVYGRKVCSCDHARTITSVQPP